MNRSIVVHQHGTPDVLQLENQTLNDLKPGEALIRNHAIGVNFIDTYFRSGLYAPEQLPFVPGNEGAGEVLAVGDEVKDINVGMRVAYVGPTGSYCDQRIMPADRLIPLPDHVAYDQAAGMMLKGLTAQYLLRQTYKVDDTTTLLFHAAAGGVGSLATAWAKKLGATVIGTVGSEAKAKRARNLGCDHVILYQQEDFVARVHDITEGKKCDVVYDSVGKSTFPASLDCLKPRGLFVSFGNASGAVDAFNLGLLAQKGSLFATRPTLFGYSSTREALLTMANELFDVMAKGWISIDIEHRYPLENAAEAHRDLEARKTSGSVILIP